MTDTNQDAALAQRTGSTAGLMQTYAEKRGLSVKEMYQTLAKTIFPTPKDATKEQVHAFLIVADQYSLNPWTKEIYAFPAKGGGVVPIVGVDGWFKLVNSHPDCDGFQLTVDRGRDGKPISATCRLHRKSWNHPVEVTEYVSECKRNTGPWKDHPTRMIRHRAFGQAARLAFGFSGIYQPDEGAAFASDAPRELRDTEVVSSDPLEAALTDGAAEVAAATKEPRVIEIEAAEAYKGSEEIDKMVAAFAKLGMDRQAVQDEFGDLATIDEETWSSMRKVWNAMRDAARAEDGIDASEAE